MENEKGTNEKLTINKYFQDSSNSDIFDQISKLNLNSKNENETVSSEISKPAVDSSLNIDAAPTSKEPVICRIFASNSEAVVEDDKKFQGEAFFDTLGSSPRYRLSTQYSDSSLKVNQPSSSSTLSPEFPSEGIS